jgi:CheY-like chemotaxis protein
MADCCFSKGYGIFFHSQAAPRFRQNRAMPMNSDDFRKLVKDALEHLYDTAYLEVHPLLAHLTGADTANRAIHAQKLRGLLKESIEILRPPQGMPSRSPEWRSYLALRYRYVQEMTVGQVENELGVSRRQLQRETQRGLEALASILWTRHGGEPATASAAELPAAVPAPELESELNQWELARQVCEVRTLVADALGLLTAALTPGQASVQIDLPRTLAPVLVDTTMTRQALLMTMRLLMQPAGGPLALTAVRQGEFMEIQLRAPAGAARPAENDWEAPRLLIRRQGGDLSVEDSQAAVWRVNIRLPMVGQTRVLVIDDNPAILQLFERYLTPQHYEIIKANNGVEILALVKESRPAVIILDIMMPNLDGWQVLRTLKENPDTAHTPIIICSVLKEPELALSLGADAYLKKPVERLALLAQVERLLDPQVPASATPPPRSPNN